MLEVLKFILEDGRNFFGTIILLGMISYILVSVIEACKGKSK